MTEAEYTLVTNRTLHRIAQDCVGRMLSGEGTGVDEEDLKLLKKTLGLMGPPLWETENIY